MTTLITLLHTDTRKPCVIRRQLTYPLNDQSKINLILSTSKADWNHNMTIERVSPIMENFFFQLKCQYNCSTILNDGTQCDGTDVIYEIHNHLHLPIHRSRGVTKENPPNILGMIELIFSK